MKTDFDLLSDLFVDVVKADPPASGPGSRGGVIIGTYPNGKPIYQRKTKPTEAAPVAPKATTPMSAGPAMAPAQSAKWSPPVATRGAVGPEVSDDDFEKATAGWGEEDHASAKAALDYEADGLYEANPDDPRIRQLANAASRHGVAAKTFKPYVPPTPKENLARLAASRAEERRLYEAKDMLLNMDPRDFASAAQSAGWGEPRKK